MENLNNNIDNTNRSNDATASRRPSSPPSTRRCRSSAMRQSPFSCSIMTRNIISSSMILLLILLLTFSTPFLAAAFPSIVVLATASRQFHHRHHQHDTKQGKANQKHKTHPTQSISSWSAIAPPRGGGDGSLEEEDQRSMRLWASKSKDGHEVTSTTTDKGDSVPLKTIQVPLDSGVNMQVTYAIPRNHGSNDKNNNKPILLFLHGSFHGGWCWTERYFAHFVQAGYTCVAPCWRGTGGTPAEEGAKKVQIAQHVADLQGLMKALPELLLENDNNARGISKNNNDQQQSVVLIAHSFASLAVMKLLEWHSQEYLSSSLSSSSLNIAGLCIMCGVPPSGNGKMTMRYLRRSLRDSYKITVGFAAKKCIENADLCRDLFFGGRWPQDQHDDDSYLGVSDADITRYQAYFKRDTAATIDLMDLAKQLPSAVSDDDGRAPFYRDLPPCLVLGATQDFIVDHEGVMETARYFNADHDNKSRVTFVESPHDVMLGRNWTHAAVELDRFLEEL